MSLILDPMPLDETAGWPADEPETITATDVEAGDYAALEAELAANDLYEELQAEFWQEVRDCCGGRAPDCGQHWRRYPPPIERPEP
jgi:hypothetical protein